MPASTHLPPLHLYRRLLREATYLPNPCAPYIRQQITTRFKKHKHDDPKILMTKQRLRAAHTHLRSLRAANAGVLDHMTHILHLTLGRCGRRRRVLMVQQFRTNVQPDKNDTRPGFDRGMPVALQRQTLHGGQPIPEDWLDHWDIPKLAALMLSQHRHKFANLKPDLTARQLKITEEQIPPENALGRPFGAKAARSRLRKYYKKVIDKLSAPLPLEEWEALRKLAKGEDGPWGENGPPPRRKRCGGAETMTTTTTVKGKKPWDWRLYAVEPVRSVERSQSRSMKARTGEQGEGPYGLGRAIGIHDYQRVRTWRRLYARIWEATPTMVPVASSERKWKIMWGERDRAKVPVALPAQMAFFGYEAANLDDGVPGGMKTRPAVGQKEARR